MRLDRLKNLLTNPGAAFNLIPTYRLGIGTARDGRPGRGEGGVVSYSLPLETIIRQLHPLDCRHQNSGSFYQGPAGSNIGPAGPDFPGPCSAPWQAPEIAGSNARDLPIALSIGEEIRSGARKNR